MNRQRKHARTLPRKDLVSCFPFAGCGDCACVCLFFFAISFLGFCVPDEITSSLDLSP